MWADSEGVELETVWKGASGYVLEERKPGPGSLPAGPRVWLSTRREQCTDYQATFQRSGR
jgi:hypothetical protein